MAHFYDAVTQVIQRWLGKNGAAYVTLRDADGNEIGSTDNPVKVDITDASVTITSSDLNVAEVETASDGTRIEPGRYDLVLNWNADHTLNYMQVVVGSSTYRKTASYSGGDQIGFTKWTLL